MMNYEILDLILFCLAVYTIFVLGIFILTHYYYMIEIERLKCCCKELSGEIDEVRYNYKK